jgi:hypothetical protein
MINLINLLNECFYVSQWLDIIRKYPQIIDLLKNDTEINRHNSLFGAEIKDWNDLDNIAYQISYLGGHCGLDATSNFNLQDMKRFILDDMTDKNAFPITKETANKLFNIIKDYFLKHPNTPNWISIEYNRLKNRLGKEKADNWLEWNKK